jgi:hypothetical protein
LDIFLIKALKIADHSRPSRTILTFGEYKITFFEEIVASVDWLDLNIIKLSRHEPFEF